MKIDLGMKVSDLVTGFQGIVTGHARYITGCDQYLVQPEPKAEDLGRVRPVAEWFDDNRIVPMDGGDLQPAALAIKNNAAGIEAAPENNGGADAPAPVK